MLLLKGKMGNLLSLKVSLVFGTLTKHSHHLPFQKADIIQQPTLCVNLTNVRLLFLNLCVQTLHHSLSRGQVLGVH